MSREKLTVRITVIVFGLMILGGAWLVSTGDSGRDSSRSDAPQQVSPDR
jgi:hypothetical protein